MYALSGICTQVVGEEGSMLTQTPRSSFVETVEGSYQPKR